MTQVSRPPLSPRDCLAAQGALPDEAVDLSEGALMLAALDHPSKSLESYREHLAALVSSLAEHGRGAVSAQDRANALAATFAEWGYHGDASTYDDPQNANLMRVIDRKKGLPVSLGILYLHAARGQGWPAEGLNFPGHFLIRVDGDAGDRAIIDPFHDGQQMQVPELRAMLKVMAGQDAELSPQVYQALTARDILFRLQTNVKLRMLEAGHIDRALEAVQRMMLFSPDDYRLWREAGLMYMRLGNLEDALEALEHYIEMAPAGEDCSRIEHVLDELRERLQ